MTRIDRQGYQHQGRWLNRRAFLEEVGGGLGGVALASLLAEEGLLGKEARVAADNPLAPRAPQGVACAKHVIQIYCPGGVSHVDVQIWCGADNVPPPRPNWDARENILVNHGKHGPVLDHGAAALIKDLKQRGLLDETLLMCTSEFGRQPAAQGKGRDHNPGAFTIWLAGGGIRGGATYGESDELGFKAVKNPCYSYDLHATCLRLLGLDHKRLTFYHNGIQRRLTDVHGQVIWELLD